MKKEFIIFVFILLLASIVSASDFPEPFIKDGNASVSIILSSNASISEKASASNIINYLSSILIPVQNKTPVSFYEFLKSQNNTKIIANESEITQVQDKNLIVLSTDCSNLIASKLLGSETILCGEDYTAKTNLKQGQFLIKVFQSPYSPEKTAMLLTGYTPQDLTKAVEYLTKNQISTNIGTELIIDANSNISKKVNIISTRLLIILAVATILIIAIIIFFVLRKNKTIEEYKV